MKMSGAVEIEKKAIVHNPAAIFSLISFFTYFWVHSQFTEYASNAGQDVCRSSSSPSSGTDGLLKAARPYLRSISANKFLRVKGPYGTTVPAGQIEQSCILNNLAGMFLDPGMSIKH